jgi:hypothetical protein
VDESHAREIASWIRDARERGLPVLVTGVALLRLADWPLGGAALAMGLLMVVGLLMGASVTFAASDGEPEDG